MMILKAAVESITINFQSNSTISLGLSVVSSFNFFDDSSFYYSSDVHAFSHN